MDGLRYLAAAALALGFTGVRAAEPELTPARLQAMLAGDRSLSTTTQRQAFDAHFADSCMAADGLPFDRTCNHVPPEDRDDPSPWPNVFLTLRGERAVAVLVEGVDWAPDSWTCTALPAFDGPLLCTPADVGARTRRRWARRWSTLLRSAG